MTLHDENTTPVECPRPFSSSRPDVRTPTPQDRVRSMPGDMAPLSEVAAALDLAHGYANDAAAFRYLHGATVDYMARIDAQLKLGVMRTVPSWIKVLLFVNALFVLTDTALIVMLMLSK